MWGAPLAGGPWQFPWLSTPLGSPDNALRVRLFIFSIRSICKKKSGSKIYTHKTCTADASTCTRVLNFIYGIITRTAAGVLGELAEFFAKGQASSQYIPGPILVCSI